MLHISVSEGLAMQLAVAGTGLLFIGAILLVALGYLINEASRKDK